ncbi:MAG: hypothetical protein IPM23_23830 [Candidatus Melainabacteria bacterium]|nr:hypothetical protein [Candidatus Melainabacteria bacterium]
MSTVAKVRAFIANLDQDAIFTTRDILTFGTRSSVDNAIYDLVKLKKIIRIVPGVFSLPGSQRKPSLKELAIIKAESFGRRIIKHASAIASELGIAPSAIPDDEVWFATNGSTSAFKFGDITIKFKPTSVRKMKLGDTCAGQVIRALNFVGWKKLTDHAVAIATAHLSSRNMRRIRALASMMPAWLSQYFMDHKRPSLVCHERISLIREESLLYIVPRCRIRMRNAEPRAPSGSSRSRPGTGPGRSA